MKYSLNQQNLRICFFKSFFLNQNTKKPNENNCPKEFLVNLSKNPRNTDKNNTCFAIVPYITGTSEPIKIILAKHNVKTTLKPFQILSQLFPKPKDKLQKQQMTGAIYSIPCKNCEKTYIGQTKTAIRNMVKETQESSDELQIPLWWNIVSKRTTKLN